MTVFFEVRGWVVLPRPAFASVMSKRDWKKIRKTQVKRGKLLDLSFVRRRENELETMNSTDRGTHCFVTRTTSSVFSRKQLNVKNFSIYSLFHIYERTFLS
jgi:hypothetical protein